MMPGALDRKLCVSVLSSVISSPGATTVQPGPLGHKSMILNDHFEWASQAMTAPVECDLLAMVVDVGWVVQWPPQPTSSGDFPARWQLFAILATGQFWVRQQQDESHFNQVGQLASC